MWNWVTRQTRTPDVGQGLDRKVKRLLREQERTNQLLAALLEVQINPDAQNVREVING